MLDRVQDPQLDGFSSQKPVSEIQFAELLPDNDVNRVVLAEVCSRVRLVLLHDPATFYERFQPVWLNNSQSWPVVCQGGHDSNVKLCLNKHETHARNSGESEPLWRKSKVVRVNLPTAKTILPQSAGKSRKSLAFGGRSSAIPVSSTQKEDKMLSNFNVDDLLQTGLQVKVMYMIPSGTVTTRVPHDEPAKNLLKNIACENWREVSIEVTSWLVSADDFSSRVARGANERVSAANE